MRHDIGDKRESAYQDKCTMTKLWEKAINEFRIKTSIVLKFHRNKPLLCSDKNVDFYELQY